MKASVWFFAIRVVLAGTISKFGHVGGMAVDVLVSGKDAFDLQKAAYALDVMGIAANQIGAHDKRYVHLDMWTKAPKGMRPRLWSY